MKKKIAVKPNRTSVRVTVSIPVFLYRVVMKRVRALNSMPIQQPGDVKLSASHVIREALRRDPTLFPVASPVSPNPEVSS